MGKLYISILFFFCICSLNAQNWEWQHPFEPYYDLSPSITIIKDLNQDVYAFDRTSTDFILNKLDIHGMLLWTKTAQGSITVTAAKIDADNNLIIVGNIDSTTTIGTTLLTPLGQQSFYILKISPNSSILSANVYGSSMETFANDLFITDNGDYLIGGGYTGSFAINGHPITGDSVVTNFFFVKTDSDQNVIWSENSTLPSGAYGIMEEIVETYSGKIYAKVGFVGGPLVYHGFDFGSSGEYLVQIDISHNINWESYLGYWSYGGEHISDIQLNGDTVYMKNEESWHTSDIAFLMWTSSGARTEKYQAISGHVGYKVADGKIYYAYTGFDDPWAATYEYQKIGYYDLDLSETNQFDSTVINESANFNAVEFINSGSLYISGYDFGFDSLFVGKYNFGFATSTLTIDNTLHFSIFPNPTNGTFNIQSSIINSQLKIYNSFGQLIHQQIITSPNQQDLSRSIGIDLSKEPKGIYIVEAGNERRKIVLN